MFVLQRARFGIEGAELGFEGDAAGVDLPEAAEALGRCHFEALRIETMTVLTAVPDDENDLSGKC